MNMATKEGRICEAEKALRDAEHNLAQAYSAQKKAQNVWREAKAQLESAQHMLNERQRITAQAEVRARIAKISYEIATR